MGFDSINKEYVEIWKKYLKDSSFEEYAKKNILCSWPLLYPPDKMTKNSILFVGFNPASGDSEKELRNLGSCNGRPEKILDDTCRRKKVIEYERKILSNKKSDSDLYKYYKVFPLIAKEVLGSEVRWTHMDLLPIRETNQEILIKHLRLCRTNLFDLSESNYKSFINDLLSVFCKALNIMAPTAIVAVNGYVSRSLIKLGGTVYENVMKYENGRDSKEGQHETSCFKIKLDRFERDGIRTVVVENKEYPLLLSSMLTGQRALDLGSRERLVWHLKKVIGH